MNTVVWDMTAYSFVQRFPETLVLTCHIIRRLTCEDCNANTHHYEGLQSRVG
jgi:hypothetical protein